MFGFFQYLGSAFLGWSLGANDSANVFGTAVSSRMISYRNAVILAAVFIVLGALIQGRAGIITLSEDLKKDYRLTSDNSVLSDNIATHERLALKAAVVTSFAAAIAVTVMTALRIPVSTSQAVVGAIVGVGLVQNNVSIQGLGKVVACWLGTPVGGALFTFIFYHSGRAILRRWRPSVFVLDPVVRGMLVVFGCYGAYALGANNVANVSAVFVGENMLSVRQAAVFGSLAIALGAITFSAPVMKTIGKSIVEMDAFSGLVCVMAHAFTVHLFAFVGVPVSSSQAIVGAIVGIGLIRGTQTINKKMLRHVALGWAATPFIAGAFSALTYFISCLRYVE